jgi:hypothetical protein
MAGRMRHLARNHCGHGPAHPARAQPDQEAAQGVSSTSTLVNPLENYKREYFVNAYKSNQKNIKTLMLWHLI